MEEAKAEARAAGGVWEDKEFEGRSALYMDPNCDKPSLPFCMARELLGDGMEVIFDGAESSDILQGGLGDCYLLSALSVLAQRKELLNRCLVVKSAAQDGVYGVRLNVRGQWRTVVLDERFPTVGGKRFAYARPCGKELWVLLIEKAYAKLFGSYQAIEGGFVSVALAHLTGGTSEIRPFKDSKHWTASVASGAFWTQLKADFEAGHLLGCGSNAGGNDTHIVQGIAQVRVGRPGWGLGVGWGGEWEVNSHLVLPAVTRVFDSTRC